MDTGLKIECERKVQLNKIYKIKDDKLKYGKKI